MAGPGVSPARQEPPDLESLARLEQAMEFDPFGGSWFDRTSGWAHSPTLLDLWGIDGDAAVTGLPLDRLPADDRELSSRSWSEVLTKSGRHSMSYTMIHGLTGEVRHLHCTATTVVTSGVLLQAVATHVDVTDSVRAGRHFEVRQTAITAERSRLLRQLGTMLATSRLGPEELLGSIVDLASSTIGDGAAIRILSADHRHIELDVTAHPDETVRRRMVATLRRSAADPLPEHGLLAEVIAKGKLLSDFRQPEWRTEYQRNFAERVYEHAAHVMVAPVRHNGIVLGKLAIFRTEPGAPYEAGDDDVLQVLADGAGAAIAENRKWQQAERARDQDLADLRKRHLELLEELAGMEARERSLLAEAIHDEPIQRLVAGILRLDHLSTRLDTTTGREVGAIIEELVSSVDWLRQLIVVALSPADLTSGLGPALAGLARSIFTATPTIFTVVGLDHVPLSAPAKECAYRIFREALGNVRKHAHAAKATLSVDERDGLIVISLTDDGVGSASLDAGAGHLGVATMRARADAEHGQLHIESVPGLGTVVTLTLPTVSTPVANDPPAVPQCSPVDFDCLRTIVVCDDSPHLRDAISLVLSTTPRFRIVGQASDADTCLQRVSDYRPDVLILDVSMAGGGPQLAKSAKELNPGMRIVVFSGRQDEPTMNAMLDAGADEYIVKTGRLRPLVEALDKAVGRQQAQQSTA